MSHLQITKDFGEDNASNFEKVLEMSRQEEQSETSELLYPPQTVFVGGYTVFTLSYYTPRKLCLWEGILFSRCPTERTTVRPNVCP